MKWRDIINKIKNTFKEKVADTEEARLARQIDNNTPPYPNCLNCGTTLEGMYCHKCGQYASERTHFFKDVFMEYINTTYPIDSQILPTVWNLFRRPGFVTTEFVAGKRLSYVHPLKLNLFFLFVVLTSLFIFSKAKDPGESVVSQLNREETLTEYVIHHLSEDPEYSKLMLSSPKDTVLLLCDVGMEKNCSQYLAALKAVPSGSAVIPDTSLMVLPKVLIDDGIFVENEDGVYSTALSTSPIVQELRKEVSMISGAWEWITDLIKKYLPLMVLLTCPILAWIIKIVNRRRHSSYLKSFVSSLHFTAFLEMFLLFIYIFSVITGIHGGMFFLWFILISTCLYLAIANHRVFEDVNWFRSGLKAIMINFAYSMFIGFLFIVGLLIAIILYLVN